MITQACNAPNSMAIALDMLAPWIPVFGYPSGPEEQYSGARSGLEACFRPTVGFSGGESRQILPSSA